MRIDVSPGEWIESSAVESDELRVCERGGDFGPRFVQPARSDYRSNDEQAALTRQINHLLGVPSGEQKVYADYGEQR